MVINDFIRWLESEERRYAVFEDNRDLCLSFLGKNAIYFCLVRFAEAPRPFLAIDTRCGLRVPQEKYSAICELIVRINESVKIGRFGLDMVEGDLYFHNSCMVLDGDLPATIYEPLVYYGLSAFDHFHPAILSVLYSDKTPVEAIRNITSKSMDENYKRHEKFDEIVKKLLEGVSEPLSEQTEDQPDASKLKRRIHRNPEA